MKLSRQPQIQKVLMLAMMTKKQLRASVLAVLVATPLLCPAAWACDTTNITTVDAIDHVFPTGGGTFTVPLLTSSDDAWMVFCATAGDVVTINFTQQGAAGHFFVNAILADVVNGVVEPGDVVNINNWNPQNLQGQGGPDLVVQHAGWTSGCPNRYYWNGSFPNCNFVSTETLTFNVPATGQYVLVGAMCNSVGTGSFTAVLSGNTGSCDGAPTAEINIKPGSDPNSINLCSGGTTPVTIWGSDTLDVNTIDPTQLILASSTVKTVGKTQKLLCSIEDAGSLDDSAFDSLGAPDGFPDLTCHFGTVELTDLDDTSQTAELSITGCDSVTPFPSCSPGDPGFFETTAVDSVNIVKSCN